MKEEKTIYQKLMLRRNRRHKDWKTFGYNTDYHKMVEIEDILSEFYNEDKITLIESRGGYI